MPSMRRALLWICSYLGLSMLVVAIWLIAAFPILPRWPKSIQEWLVAAAIFLLALPVQMLLESVGHWAQNNRLSRLVERKTKKYAFSGFRIFYMLIFYCVIIAIGIGLTALWRYLFT